MLEVGMKVKVNDDHVGVVRGLRKEGRHVLVDGYEGGHDGDGLHDKMDCQWLSDEAVEEVK